MPTKKYQVFISSTYTDLKDERNDISRAILNLNHIPAGMELFPAIDEEQFSFIQKVIDDCDYYVLILGGRYGSLSASGIGYTELEYDYALEKGLKVIVLVHNATGSIAAEKSEMDPELVGKLTAFRKKVTTRRLAKFWHDRPTLQAAFYESFSQTTTAYPAVGWIRGDTVTNESLLAQINDVRNENDRLKSDLSEAAKRAAKKFDDLAPMDAEFTFLVSGPKGFEFGHRNITLTWNIIFQQVASELRGLRPRESLNFAVTKCILGGEAFSVSGQSKIDDQSWERILIQLTTVGLIHTIDRKRYELTEAGLSYYTEAIVLRAENRPGETTSGPPTVAAST